MDNFQKTRLILVGGFLGAGKTTLLAETSRRLIQSGKRVSLITNDQAPQLVDTAWLRYTEASVSEVSGSCFCCNYDGLLRSLHFSRTTHKADFIIAEPVGSCTDLSATILQPLKEQLNSGFVLCPLTVLADPLRLNYFLAGEHGDLHPDVSYIFGKQLEEADLILISKSDVLKPEEITAFREKLGLIYPGTKVIAISALTGEGLDTWFTEILSDRPAGSRIAEIEYDRYAEGEAALGWLNTRMVLFGNRINWDQFANEFLSGLGHKMDAMNILVGHIKILIECGDQYLVGNITGRSETKSVRGRAGVRDQALILINARAGTSPGMLEQLVDTTLFEIGKNSIGIKSKDSKSLIPGYPRPAYRYSRPV